MRKVALVFLHKFSRNKRLITKQDFQAVFDQPIKVKQSSLLALLKQNQKPHARLGIIVGKRLVATAVKRNQIKRIIRESFRHHQTTLQGLDIIILLRSYQAELADKNTLQNNIGLLWQQLIKFSQPV